MLGPSSKRRRKDLANNQELLAVLEQRFSELTESIEESRAETRGQFERIDARFEQIDGRLDRIEGETRHAHVRIEALDGSVRQLAESVVAVDQKVDRLDDRMGREFDDVRSLIRLSYRQLDQRVSALENRCE